MDADRRPIGGDCRSDRRAVRVRRVYWLRSCSGGWSRSDRRGVRVTRGRQSAYRKDVQALVWTAPERMEVQDAPPPRPGPGEALVSVEAAGICGSDIEGYLGRMSNRVPPLIMGHEFAGRVTAVGDGASSSAIGRRVAVNPLITCGRCVACRDGLRNVCQRRRLVGVDRPGGFAEEVAVSADALVFLPEGCDPRLGALAEPFANGVHAVRLGSAARTPKTVLVLGAGTIGLLVVQAARIAGIGLVAISEPHPGRRDQALELGADAAYPDAADALAAARGLAEGGFELVVDAAGVEASRRLAVEALRPAGVAVMVGLHADATAIPFHRLVRSQLTVHGSYAYTDEDFSQAARWLAEGRVGLGPLPAVRPLADGPAIFAEAAKAPPAEVKLFLGPAA